VSLRHCPPIALEHARCRGTEAARRSQDDGEQLISAARGEVDLFEREEGDDDSANPVSRHRQVADQRVPVRPRGRLRPAEQPAGRRPQAVGPDHLLRGQPTAVGLEPEPVVRALDDPHRRAGSELDVRGRGSPLGEKGVEAEPAYPESVAGQAGAGAEGTVGRALGRSIGDPLDGREALSSEIQAELLELIRHYLDYQREVVTLDA